MDISLAKIAVIQSVRGVLPDGKQSPEQELNWQRGQILQGQVMSKLAENTYLFRVRGQDVVVQSPYRLTEGMVVTMKVLGQNQGQYEVSLLDISRNLDTLLNNIMNRLPLLDTPANRALVQGFLKHDLPLEPKLIQRAENMIKLLGGSEPAAHTDIVLQAFKSARSLSPRAVEALNYFLTGLSAVKAAPETQLAGFLDKLARLINGQTASSNHAPDAPAKAAGETPPVNHQGKTGVAVPLAREELALANQVRALLNNPYLIKPGDEGPLQAALLKLADRIPLPKIILDNLGNLGSLRRLVGPEGPGRQNASVTPGNTFSQWGTVNADVTGGTGHPGGAGTRPAAEIQLADFLNRLTAMVRTERGQAPATGTSGEPGGSRAGTGNPPSITDIPLSREGYVLLNQLQNLLNSSALHAGKGEPQLAAGLKELVNARLPGVIHEDLGRLLNHLETALRDAGHPAQGQRLWQEGKIIEQQLFGQQIFQGTLQGGAPSKYLYFNFPILHGDHNRSWGQLVIRREGEESKAIDKNNFGLALLLQTENLGPVSLDIKVYNRQINASGRVTEKNAGDILSGAWPLLQEAFAATGYHLGPCHWRVEDFPPVILPGEGAGVTGDNATEALSGWKMYNLDITV